MKASLRQMNIRNRYGQNLAEVCKTLGNKGTTMSSDLDKIGRHLFRGHWRGVHSMDDLAFMKDFGDEDDAVVNLDDSSEPGSHWIGLHKHDGVLLLFDSFGRRFDRIAPDILEHWLGKTKQIKCGGNSGIQCQKDMETNCGQRVIAWMMSVK